MVFGRSHAVDHAEDLELRLEFVRNEVDGYVGLANRILDGRSQLQRTVGSAEARIGVFHFSPPELCRHYVFQHDVEACRGTCHCEAAASLPSPDDRNRPDRERRLGGGRLGHFLLATALMTAS